MTLGYRVEVPSAEHHNHGHNAQQKPTPLGIDPGAHRNLKPASADKDERQHANVREMAHLEARRSVGGLAFAQYIGTSCRAVPVNAAAAGNRMRRQAQTHVTVTSQSDKSARQTNHWAWHT